MRNESDPPPPPSFSRCSIANPGEVETFSLQLPTKQGGDVEALSRASDATDGGGKSDGDKLGGCNGGKSPVRNTQTFRWEEGKRLESRPIFMWGKGGGGGGRGGGCKVVPGFDRSW